MEVINFKTKREIGNIVFVNEGGNITKLKVIGFVFRQDGMKVQCEQLSGDTLHYPTAIREFDDNKLLTLDEAIIRARDTREKFFAQETAEWERDVRQTFEKDN